MTLFRSVWQRVSLPRFVRTWLWRSAPHAETTSSGKAMGDTVAQSAKPCRRNSVITCCVTVLTSRARMSLMWKNDDEASISSMLTLQLSRRARKTSSPKFRKRCTTSGVISHRIATLRILLIGLAPSPYWAQFSFRIQCLKLLYYDLTYRREKAK